MELFGIIIIVLGIVLWVKYVGYIEGYCEGCYGFRRICTKKEWRKYKPIIREAVEDGDYTCRACGGKIVFRQ